MNTNRLNKLLRDLNCDDSSKKRSAAEAMTEGDDRVIYPLIKALRDENFGVQDAAMRSLMEIKKESTAYMVLPLLREDSFLRNTAMIILKEMGGIAVPLFRMLLKDKDDDVRKFILDLIYEIEYCDYPDEIVAMLIDDSNANVRASAAKTLGKLKYKEAIPHLVHALQDEEWVCFSALEALTDFKDVVSIHAILKLLKSSSEAVRFAAIEALGQFSSPEACDPLIKHMEVADELEEQFILKSLVQIGNIPSIPRISEMLIEMLSEEDWDDKIVALKGLSILKEQKALNRIIDLAGSLDISVPDNEEKHKVVVDLIRSFGCNDALINVLSDPAIKYRGKAIAIEVLGELKCQEAVPALIKFIKSDIRDVRRSSVKSLGQMESEEAKGYLMEAISNPDSHVRKTAASALGQIRDMSAFEPLIKMLHEETYTDVIDEIIISLLRINSELILSRTNEFNEGVIKRIESYSSSFGPEVTC
jgi:HEAT repeat protein